MTTGRQMRSFGLLLGAYAAIAFLTYTLIPLSQLAPVQGGPVPDPGISGWQLGLVNAGVILVLYGLLGLAGFWLARRLALPGIYRPHAGWEGWIVAPMAAGLVLGIVLVALDRAFSLLGNSGGLAHPTFPLSIFASASAGIGEEIIFRGFVFGIWAYLFNLFLWRWVGKGVALFLGNLVAALAFGAAHLPSAMILAGAASVSDLPSVMLAEIFLLNGVLGLAAGRFYIKGGLVSAAGIHFWADVVWHVAWPAIFTALG